MTSHVPSYHGYRFLPEIISHAVWLYHRFGLSFRDAEDLLAQRAVRLPPGVQPPPSVNTSPADSTGRCNGFR